MSLNLYNYKKRIYHWNLMINKMKMIIIIKKLKFRLNKKKHS